MWGDRHLPIALALVVASITPTLDVAGHSIEFREAAGSDKGRQAMLLAAKSLAMTAVDLLVEPKHLERARATAGRDRAAALKRN